ncbi:MAG: hypothetical protein HYW10_03755, partial [Candidatus Omnitrophica bacterium]|nr:hypothetical protein [Candidatus Omnitrophota bacterium]
VALLISPALVLAGTTGLAFLPVFWLAAATELCDGSLNYSLQQTSKEVLYLPIDRSIRYKIKPFIDMVVFRFGKGIAAVIGIVLLDVLHAPVRILSGVTIPFLLAMLAVALRLPRDYIATIRTMLQARAAERRRPLPSAVLSGADHAGPPPAPSATQAVAGAPTAAGHDEPVPIGSLMDNQPSTQKLALFERLVTSDGSPSALTRELLAALTDYEIGVASPSALRGEATRLQAIIDDEGRPMAQRRQAIRQLVQLAHHEAVDYLFRVAMREGDAMLRREAVYGLVTLRLRGARPAFPVQPIQRQIAHEVATYQRIRGVVAVYRGHHQGPPREDDPVLLLLRVLLEESVEQIFRFLMLRYRPEDIHLVYEQMRSSEDLYLRTDAIELLDNLIDPSLRATLFPILDEDRFLSFEHEGVGRGLDPTTTDQILQEAIWDHNCWLSVTTLCAVGRLRLTPMRQELEKVSLQHRVPLVSTAAKVALHMSGLP